MPLTGKTARLPEPHSSREQEEEEPGAKRPRLEPVETQPMGPLAVPGLCGTRSERLLAVIRRRRQSDQTYTGGNPCGGLAGPGRGIAQERRQE